jgi:ParB family chromosome partitioning protein
MNSAAKVTPETIPGREGGPSRLGRGLAALIGDVDTEKQAVERARGQRRVPIEMLSPNPRNPRKTFAEEELGDLARSIREKGIVQPILARPLGEGGDRFEIIAGERRWRAAQQAGLHEVPVIVHRVDDREALEIAIIENVQRADLNPLEEAEGYSHLIAEFGYTQQALADVIGKSRSHVANTLRLLKLPDSVRAHIQDGRLSAGHARTLVTHEDPELAARAIIKAGMNVREAEALSRRPAAESQQARPGRPPAPEKDADTRALEARIGEVLGLDVEIRHRADGKGEIRLRYASLEQLDYVVARLTAQPD